MGPGCNRFGEVVRMDGVARSPTLQFFASSTKILQGLIIDGFYLSVGRHNRYQTGDAIDDQADTLFALAERLLRALAILDVESRPIPLDYFSLLISQGNAAVEEPAVLTVTSSPQPCFILERRSGDDRLAPLPNIGGNVIGV